MVPLLIGDVLPEEDPAGVLKEIQWRRNLPDGTDVFISLLLCIRDGCFQ